MRSSGKQAAENDIALFTPPPGLSKGFFDDYTAGLFNKMPIVAKIDRLTLGGFTESQVPAILAERQASDSPDSEE